jgi:hypothetical protein
VHAGRIGNGHERPSTLGDETAEGNRILLPTHASVAVARDRRSGALLDSIAVGKDLCGLGDRVGRIRRVLDGDTAPKGSMAISPISGPWTRPTPPKITS